MGRVEQVVEFFKALAQGNAPSVALAQKGGAVLGSLGVGGIKILSPAEFLEGLKD